MNKRIFSLFTRCLLWLSLLLAPLAHALDQDDLLPPEQAFAVTAERQGAQLRLTVTVADGYYLYRDRSRFETIPAALITQQALPPGKPKDDPYFGKQATYPPGPTVMLLTLRPDAPQQFTLKATVQGCADAGLCYPPYTHTLAIGGDSKALSPWLQPAGTQGDDRPPPQREGLAATLAAFFAAGLGMAFTACMYPLLPIVSSLIAGQGQHLTRRRGFLLALTYVQGLAVSYTAIGIVAGLTGSLLSVWLQQPAVILGASLLMVVFALGMFDIVSIQLPSSWQTRLAASSNRLSGGHIVTVFGMGVLSALLIGPCVGPPLALALGYIGQTGDAWLGGVALYAMAMGLGLPLVIVGTFGGHVLPRAGMWMKTVKAVFGVVMLAVAIWLATPFLPAIVVMLLWAALALASAVFLKAFDPLPPNASSVLKLGKALGLLLALVATLQLVGVFSGAKSARYPLAALGATAGNSSKPPFRNIGSVAELDAALNAARGQPVLLDFYADWCVSCIEMEDTTFRDPAVQQAMAKVVLLKADVTANLPAHQALLQRFSLYGPPGMIFFDRHGKEQQRLIGYSPADEFLPLLQRQQSGG
ncbi:protein-disulfide reductase DsbD [Vogesella indigofera]|uniref:protein-disulfide reductase DsbD n=1 Tax=Vogesella indigofera TaxID=45465 RepID=UPI00234F65C1|nr:protein-disulfide reductase DsbD [Vogesella indigofera]MDC7707548.1 protein-disulfide reductase DsbD [Vogesella indigofera]